MLQQILKSRQMKYLLLSITLVTCLFGPSSSSFLLSRREGIKDAHSLQLFCTPWASFLPRGGGKIRKHRKHHEWVIGRKL